MSAELLNPVCAVLTRNASPYILGWITWHISLGFRRILVLDAGSTDGTPDIVRAIGTTWPVDLYELPRWEDTAAARRLALTRLAVSRLREDERWLLVLDSDEYLDPSPDLATLLERGRDAAGIALNWCIFGSAGQARRPRGHIVATHSRRAEDNFPDHGFFRVLAKTDRLAPPETLADPFLLGIDPAELVDPEGEKLALTPHGGTARTAWDGGRILHYVCPSADEAASMAPWLRQHFDRNDVEDQTPRRHLPAVRRAQNVPSLACLERGADRLAALAEAHVQALDDSAAESSALPERAEAVGFRYQRLRPTARERLLLSAQGAPPPGRMDLFLLRAPSGALLKPDLLETGASSDDQPLIGLIQDEAPRVLSLFLASEARFVLGDCPCPTAMAVVTVRRSHKGGALFLAEETGHAEVAFEAVPYRPAQRPKLLTLPATDHKDGLSLSGLYNWIALHDAFLLQDLQRVLCLLSPSAAEAVSRLVPELTPFLHR